jgi:hypothetical protein
MAAVTEVKLECVTCGGELPPLPIQAGTPARTGEVVLYPQVTEEWMDAARKVHPDCLSMVV